jgi:hypothetical protein
MKTACVEPFEDVLSVEERWMGVEEGEAGNGRCQGMMVMDGDHVT